MDSTLRNSDRKRRAEIEKKLSDGFELVRAALILLATGDTDDASDWVDQDSSPLPKRMFLQLCRNGELTARAVGKRRLVRRDDLDAYLDAHPQTNSEPIATTPTADPMANAMRNAARRGRR